MSADWIEERLRKERPEHLAPSGFTERVMSNLPAQFDYEKQHTRKENPIRWPRLTMAAATIAIAAIFLFEILRPDTGRVASLNSSATIEIARGSNQSFQSAELIVPEISAAQLGALTMKLDEPLQKELENVISDTRNAIQFVASNFLPEK